MLSRSLPTFAILLHPNSSPNRINDMLRMNYRFVIRRSWVRIPREAPQPPYFPTALSAGFIREPLISSISASPGHCKNLAVRSAAEMRMPTPDARLNCGGA